MQIPNINSRSTLKIISNKETHLELILPQAKELNNITFISEAKKNIKFIPLDHSPQTQASHLLKEQGIIDNNWNPTSNKEIDFSFDKHQKKWFDEIIKNEICLKHNSSSCHFDLKSLLSYLEKNCSRIEKAYFIGGINRFFVCSSSEFCRLVLNEAGAKIPLELITSLLLNHKHNLPDIDIRFQLKPPPPFEKINALNECRDHLIDFFHLQFEKNSSYIPNSTIKNHTLKKIFLIPNENLTYSIIAFGKTKLEFSSFFSWVEAMFVIDMEITHLFPRDNVQVYLPCGSQDENSKVGFSSDGNKQLKAFLHIWFKKIELEHTTDFNGLIRVISLLKEGNTLINPIEEFQKRLAFFVTDSFVDVCSKAILRCLENHYPHNLESYPLFLYSLGSLLDKKTRDLYLSSIWTTIMVMIDIKYPKLRFSPLCSLITHLICEENVSFDLIEAVVGLAGTIHLSCIDANSTSPTTILEEHGKEPHIQLGIEKGGGKDFLFTPFIPDIFFQRLSEQLSEENAKSLMSLFFEIKNLCSSKCKISLLEAYFSQFSETFSKLFFAISNVNKHTNPLLSAISEQLTNAFQIADLNSETFLSKIEEASSPEERILIWRRFYHKLGDSPLAQLLKNKEKRWIKILGTSFKSNHAMRFWIYLLAQANDFKLACLALDLCARHHQKYRILSLEFCQQMLPILFSQDFSLSQRLIRIVQKKQGPPFPIRDEFQIISKMLEELQKRSSRICGLPEIVSGIRILEHFVNRYEKEKQSSLTFSESAILFLEKLFCEGFYQEAKDLLQKMTQLALISPKEPETQSLWVASYAVESTHKKTSSIVPYRFWKEGHALGIWQSQIDCPVFLESMTKAIEELNTVASYEEQLSEMLCNFKLSEISKEIYGDRVQFCAKKIIENNLGKKSEKSLKQAEKYLISFKRHLQPEKRHDLMLSLFEAYLPLKAWDHAFKLWNAVMKSKERNIHVKKISLATENFIEWLLNNRQLPIITKILLHSDFQELQPHLVNVWEKNPINTFKFLNQNKNLIAKEILFSISRYALNGIASFSIEKQGLFFSKAKILELCEKNQLSQQVGNLIIELIKTPSEQAIKQCLHFLSYYRPKESAPWTVFFSYIENFKDPLNVWNVFQIALLEIPQEEAAKCLQGALLCLKNNKSPILLKFFEELLSKQSPFFSLMNELENPQLYMELVCTFFNTMISLFEEKLLNRFLSDQIMLHILFMTKKFEHREELQSFHLAIHNRSIEYCLLTEDFEQFVWAAKIASEFFIAYKDFIPKKTIFKLMKQGILWEKIFRFTTCGIIDLLAGIIRSFMHSEEKEELLKLAHILSFYQSEEMVLIASNFIMYKLLGYYLSPLEMLQTLHKEQQKKTPEIDEENMLIVHDKQPQRKCSRVKADTNFGKVLIRHVETLSKSTKRENFVTIKFFLQQDELYDHLCLSSLSILWDKCCDMEFKHILNEEDVQFSNTHLTKLLELGRMFAEDLVLLDYWRRKIFKIILPLLNTKSENIFYSGFCLLFSYLTPAQSLGTMNIDKKTNTQNISVYTIRFQTPNKTNKKFIEQQKRNCQMSLEFLEIVLKKYEISKNIRLENFISENLSSIFEFIYCYQFKHFDKKKLQSVFNTYMEESSGKNMVSFWDQFAKRHDYPILFGELFIPVLMKLLNTENIIAQTKAYCMLRFTLVAEGKVPGFPFEVVEKLYHSALNTLFKLLRQNTLNEIYELFNLFKALLLMEKEELHPLANKIKKHLKLMEEVSIIFFKRFLEFVDEEKRTITDSNDILIFTLFFLKELNDGEKNFSKSIKYKAILIIILSKITKRMNIDFLQNTSIFRKLSNDFLSLIFSALEQEDTPDESLLFLTKEWLLAIKSIDDPTIIKIADKLAVKFCKFISQKYEFKIYEKYLVPYTRSSIELHFSFTN